MLTNDILATAEKNYNRNIDLLGSELHSVGYHTMLPDCSWVHGTRSSIYYALHLLKQGGQEQTARAVKIIEAIIALQDHNSYSETYGIWSWYYEESLEQMNPPDWNWADFIGVALALIVNDYGKQLPQSLLPEIYNSVGHAAWSIFRRNVRPDYTNIAIMGVTVTAAAGELLQETRLLQYARARMQSFMAYTRAQGGLNEYNSPCYTFVALHETEKIIHLVNDRQIRQQAEELRSIIWEKISTYYHPGTGQLSGPHSRTYQDLLDDSTKHYIDWACSESPAAGYQQQTVEDFLTPLSCPAKYRSKFLEPITGELEHREVFIQKEADEKSFSGTTWMNSEVTLGSINHECFWEQRRPLLAYWQIPGSKPAVLRLRMLKNGKDFASGGLYNAQHNNRILTGITSYSDRGDTHLFLDHPADNRFTCRSLILRYELTADGADVTNPAQCQYELTAGNWKAVITAPSGVFNSEKISWRMGREPGKVYLEAVLYEGEECQLQFDDTTLIQQVLTTEVVKKSRVVDNQLPVLAQSNHTMTVNWKNLILNYNPYCSVYE